MASGGSTAGSAITGGAGRGWRGLSGGAGTVAFLVVLPFTYREVIANRGVILRDWRIQALKGLPTIFDRRDDIAALTTTHAQQVDELYAEIGRLTTQLTWLKKKLPPSLIKADER